MQVELMVPIKKLQASLRGTSLVVSSKESSSSWKNRNSGLDMRNRKFKQKAEISTVIEPLNSGWSSSLTRAESYN